MPCLLLRDSKAIVPSITFIDRHPSTKTGLLFQIKPLSNFVNRLEKSTVPS